MFSVAKESISKPETQKDLTTDIKVLEFHEYNTARAGNSGEPWEESFKYYEYIRA
jgi:hypothetical protein